MIGVILVFICLIVFFDLRVAVWITVGIPLSTVANLVERRESSTASRQPG